MSATEFGSAPFLITIALADGDVVRVPAADHAELDRLLGRMSGTCEAAGVPMRATIVWRLDAGSRVC